MAASKGGTEIPRLVEIDALDGEFVATTPDGTQVVLRGVWDSVEVWCQGPRGHFRDDGGCEHADELLATQSVERPLTVIPFGGDCV